MKLNNKRSGLLKGASVLAGSNALGQCIALAASPFLTRMYSPSEFGVLAVYMSLVEILGVVACLRYDTAVALPESRVTAANIVVLSLVVAGSMSLVSLFTVVIFRVDISALFGMPELLVALWFLPLGIFFLGCLNIFSYWWVREEEYLLVGKTRLFQVVASLLTQLSAYQLGSLGLLLGHVVNQGVGGIKLGWSALNRMSLNDITVGRLLNVLVRYKRFPLVATWAALLNRTGTLLPSLMFAALFSPAVAGLYALATRVVKAPAGVLSKALHYAFLSAVSSSHRNGEAGYLTIEVHGGLAKLIMPPLIAFAFVSPEIFGVIFGAEWVVAGQYAQWMSVLVYFSIVVSPLMVLFSVLERQFDELVFQVVFVAIRVLAISIGWALGSSLLAIGLFSVASGLGYLLFLFWASWLLKFPFYAVMAQMAKAFMVGVLVSSPIVMAKIFGDDDVWIIVGGLTTLIFLVIYCYREYAAFVSSRVNGSALVD